MVCLPGCIRFALSQCCSDPFYPVSERSVLRKRRCLCTKIDLHSFLRKFADLHHYLTFFQMVFRPDIIQFLFSQYRSDQFHGGSGSSDFHLRRFLCTTKNERYPKRDFQIYIIINHRFRNWFGLF